MHDTLLQVSQRLLSWRICYLLHLGFAVAITRCCFLPRPQRMIARYEAVIQGRRPHVTPGEEPAVRSTYEQTIESQARVRQLIDELAGRHPELNEVFDRVKQLTEI